MSKLKKFLLSPKLFFEDARKNKNKNKNKEDVVASSIIEKKSEQKLQTQQKLQLLPSEDTRKDDIYLARKLLEIEFSYPVNNIKLYNKELGIDFYLWPFLRHFFWVRAQAFYKGKDPDKISTSKMYISPEWRSHYKSVADVKDISQIETQSTDFLFFTNLRGTEQTIVNKKIYNRITDPVFEFAKNIGVSKKIEIVKSIGVLKKSEDRFHSVELLYPPLLRKVGYRPLINLPKNFLSQVNLLLPEIKISEDAILSEIEFFLNQREFYIDLLQKYNPKVVFFVGFDYYYGLILAAKELGIKTVDLQHGVQAGWSPVYNNWQALPRNGYEMLPDYFWVWGEYDKCKIEENFPIENICALVGGYPWMSRQEDFFSDSKLFKQNDAYKIGVISLQDQKIFPKIFSDIVLSTKGKILWVVRRHPKHQNIKFDHLIDIVLSGKKYDECNFSIILKNSSIHLTECSTSVIDADYFGVPSIVTGEQGFINYKDFIEDGSIFYIKSSSEAQKVIDDILCFEKVSKMNVINNSDTTKQALEKILGDYLG